MLRFDPIKFLGLLSAVVLLGILPGQVWADTDKGPNQELARPTPQHLAWHEMEIEMFLCLDPATWQNREYDNHSTPLSKINPTRLDTDQWCRVAKSFGARQIIFVAKHTGGFCWWQSETTDYSIKNAAWKDGKGDVLAELADSCKKHGLKLGIYVYPGDDTWGAPMGSGGKTRDPSQQEAYNKVFRQQMTEVLSQYGPMSEVWFDGSCVIEVGNILKKYAPDAMIFQGPYATIRWVGNERGIGPDPCWNAVKKTDAASGVATSVHGDPNGNVWLPNEVDTTLLDHKWFWGENTDHMFKSPEQLMDIYYKSVGRGCVLLLNATPDTSGLIHENHVQRYAEFGAEIKRRFGQCLTETKGAGNLITLSLEKPTTINHTIIMEDVARGQRVRQYTLEGLVGDQWRNLFQGTSIGYKKIDIFDSVTVSAVRLRVTESIGPAQIKRFAVFNVKPKSPALEIPAPTETAESTWQQVGAWDAQTIKTAWTTLDLNLSPFIPQAGQYEVQFQKVDGPDNFEIKSAIAVLEGMETSGFAQPHPVKPDTYIINRTAVVSPDRKETTHLRMAIRFTGSGDGKIQALIRPLLPQTPDN